MAGENLRDSTMEVALVTGKQYNFVLAESRVLPLKTGGTAESSVLSIFYPICRDFFIGKNILRQPLSA